MKYLLLVLILICIPTLAFAKGQIYVEAGLNTIYIDNMYVGQGSQLVDLEPGGHQVIVKDPSGREIRNELVLIRDLQTTRIVIGVEKEVAEQQIQQKKIDAGVQRGATPVEATEQSSSSGAGQPRNILGVGQLRLLGFVGFKDYKALTTSLTYTFAFQTQYGGTIELAIPVGNLFLVLAGDLAAQSAVSYLGIPYANVSIHSTRVNIEIPVFSSSGLFSLGAGVNYSYYDGGSGYSVSGGMGYQAYGLIAVPFNSNLYSIEICYEFNTGKTSYPSTITNEGLVVRAGTAYLFR